MSKLQPTAVLKLLPILALLIGALPLLAQGPPSHRDPGMDHDDRYEKMKALKVAYITTKLELTTAEAQTFWPIYNEYQSKRVEMKQQEGRNYRSDLKGIEEMTDAELEVLLNNYIDLEEKEVVLERTYLDKFKTVLPLRKVAMLLRAEHDFKREVIKELHKREPSSN